MSKHRQAAGAYHLDLSQDVGGQAVVVPDADYFESASGVQVTGVPSVPSSLVGGRAGARRKLRKKTKRSKKVSRKAGSRRTRRARSVKGGRGDPYTFGCSAPRWGPSCF